MPISELIKFLFSYRGPPHHERERYLAPILTPRGKYLYVYVLDHHGVSQNLHQPEKSSLHEYYTKNRERHMYRENSTT